MKKKEKTKKVKKNKNKKGEGKKRLSKKKLILLLAVMVLIVAAAVYFLLLRGGDDAEAEGEGEVEPIVQEDPVVSAPLSYTLDEGLAVMALPVGRDVEVKVHTWVEEPEVVEEEEPDDAPVEDDETNADDADAENEENAEGEDGTDAADADADDAADADAETETIEPRTFTTYIYSGAGADAARLQLYCELLTAADFGFVALDEEMMETELPSFEESSGTLRLARAVKATDYVESVNVAGEGEAEHLEDVPQEEKELEGSYLVSLRIEWDATSLQVTPSLDEGSIRKKPAPSPMSVNEAVDFMYSLTPAELGLAGESMDAYLIFPLDGRVMVNGSSAVRMYVYSKSEVSGTNVYEGQYLLADDGRRIYCVQGDGSLKEIERS